MLILFSLWKFDARLGLGYLWLVLIPTILESWHFSTVLKQFTSISSIDLNETELRLSFLLETISETLVPLHIQSIVDSE